MSKPLPSPPRTPELDKLAREARDFMDRGDEHAAHGVRDWIEAGRRLAKARELCGYGQWEVWLQRHFPKRSYRTCMNYIAIFKRFGSIKPETIAGLPAEVVRMLSGPSVPQSAVDDVIAEAQLIGNVTAALAKEAIHGSRSQRLIDGLSGAAADLARPAPAETGLPQHEPEVRGHDRAALLRIARRGLTLSTFHPMETLSDLRLDLMRLRDIVDALIDDVDRAEQSEQWR